MVRPKIDRFQLIVHILLMAAAWGLYAYGLYHAFDLPSKAYKIVLIVLSLEFVALIITTISWVGHHLGLHRKFGARTQIPNTTWNYTEDWLGYKIEGAFEDL